MSKSNNIPMADSKFEINTIEIDPYDITLEI
jgi:hypothetical protein